MLQEGQPAPDFELPDGDGNIWRLSDLKGRKVILYFYPADDTPGCTVEACDFRDSMEPLKRAGYTVLGVSPQGADSHQAFSTKYSLNFPLLVDSDHAVAEAYGAWGTKKNYGKTYEGLIRSTFVIDEEGNLSSVQYNVKAKGHVDRITSALQIGPSEGQNVEQT